MNWPTLYPGETVVWRGRPVRSKYARKDAILTVTGIPVAVFITVWMSMALRIPKKGGPGDFMAWFFPAFGMIFVVQALYRLVGHYLRNWMEWRNIEYAVTNRRTIVRKGLWRISELSRPHSDSPIEVRGSGSEIGDVIFKDRPKPTANRLREQLNGLFNSGPKEVDFGLYAVEHPADVYRTILLQAGSVPNTAEHSG